MIYDIKFDDFRLFTDRKLILIKICRFLTTNWSTNPSKK